MTRQIEKQDMTVAPVSDEQMTGKKKRINIWTMTNLMWEKQNGVAHLTYQGMSKPLKIHIKIKQQKSCRYDYCFMVQLLKLPGHTTDHWHYQHHF